MKEKNKSGSRAHRLEGLGMTKPDWADEKAAELLPCKCDGFYFNGDKWVEHHVFNCAARYRPAIAVALREKQAEIERIRAYCDKWRQLAFEADQAKGCAEENLADLGADLGLSRIHELYDEINALKAEIEALKQDNAKLREGLEWLNRNITEIDIKDAIYKVNELLSEQAEGDDEN